jgi:quercetin dioxygenase-like cupin family protein
VRYNREKTSETEKGPAMKVNLKQDLTPTEVNAEGTKDITLRMLVGPNEGSEAIHMRLFTVRPGGHTPRHEHPWEHLIKTERGRGVVVDAEGNELPLEAGTSVFVEPGELHQFKNPYNEDFEFICVIPNPETRK